MQLRKKEQETSNRLLDVQGHSVPEAEVIYIYLFPFLPPVFLFVSLEDVSHSVSLPTSTLAGMSIQTGDLPGTNCLLVHLHKAVPVFHIS